MQEFASRTIFTTAGLPPSEAWLVLDAGLAPLEHRLLIILRPLQTLPALIPFFRGRPQHQFKLGAQMVAEKIFPNHRGERLVDGGSVAIDEAKHFA